MILSASSSYFRAMFTGGMSEETKSRVELKTISAATFSNLLSFIYTGNEQKIVIVKNRALQIALDNWINYILLVPRSNIPIREFSTRNPYSSGHVGHI